MYTSTLFYQFFIIKEGIAILKAIVVHLEDNVATALDDIKKGYDPFFICPDKSKIDVKALEDIPFGHKIAIKDIDGDVIKYGEVIGESIGKITAGSYVHVHNVKSLRGRGDIVK